MENFKGNIVDLIHKRIYPETFSVIDAHIVNLKEIPKVIENDIVPKFIDAHIHIEKFDIFALPLSRELCNCFRSS